MKGNPTEDAFGMLVRIHGLPPPVREHRFHPARRWRFDFAWPDIRLSGGWRIAVEIEGVFRVPAKGDAVPGSDVGGHRTVSGFLKDAEKHREALLLGWIVLRIPSVRVYRRGRIQNPIEEMEFLLKFLGRN